MANFLDKTGLGIVWARINAKFIAQPAANSVTTDHVVKFTITTDNENNTIIGVADSGYTIASNVPSGAVFTDESTTKAGHYTPQTADNYQPTAGTWTWGTTEAITGITKDDKGHIVSVTSVPITNPVSADTVTSSAALDSDKVVLGNGTKTVKASTYSLGTGTFGAQNVGATTLATEAGVRDYVTVLTNGLTTAMHFVGETSTDLEATPAATTLVEATTDSLVKTTGFIAGDVVISGTAEYVFNGSIWILLGDEGSYALSDNVVNSWTGSGDSYITVTPASAAKGNVSATIRHNTVSNGAYSQKGTATTVPQITTDAAGHITLIDDVNITFPVTSVAGKIGVVVLDSFKVGTKNGNAAAVDVVDYNGSSASGLYFSNASATETNVEFAVDANGVVTGTVLAGSAPGNAALKVQGTSGNATETGFTANASNDGTITFAKSGASISSITTSGGTVTINGVNTLPNEYALGVTSGAFVSGTSGALQGGYDGSAAKTLTFDNTSATAPANSSSTGNVQFTVTTDGYIKGEYLLPANAFLNDDTYVSSASFTGGDGTGTQADSVSVVLGRTTTGNQNGGQVTSYIPAATTTLSGVMTKDMVTKLNGIDTAATSDEALSSADILEVCV